MEGTKLPFLFYSVLLSGLKDEKLIKRGKPTRKLKQAKLKHANSILQYFKYLCQKPNVIKVDPNIFDLYRLKVGALHKIMYNYTLQLYLRLKSTQAVIRRPITRQV